MRLFKTKKEKKKTISKLARLTHSKRSSIRNLKKNKKQLINRPILLKKQNNKKFKFVIHTNYIPRQIYVDNIS
jgi:hypothetical protein